MGHGLRFFYRNYLFAVTSMGVYYMTSRIIRPCLCAVLSAAVLSLVCQGASADAVIFPGEPVLPDFGPVVIGPSSSQWVIHRLTQNKVRDKNVRISGRTIYWERFGGEQGDTEIFSFSTSPYPSTSPFYTNDKKERLTNNKLGDTLQDGPIWTSAATDISPRDIVMVSAHAPQLHPLSIEQNKREYRRSEVFGFGRQITKNRFYETSVQVADKHVHGMAWLSKKISYGTQSLDDPAGYDVIRLNGRNRRVTRLTETPNATSVAFGGPWVAWSTLDKDKVELYRIRTEERRSLDAHAPINLDSSGQYVKYETSGGQKWYSGGIAAHIDIDYESRVFVYDALADTTTEVGMDPSLGYHRDFGSILSDEHVVYTRSFSPPFIPINKPVLPALNELRLFSLTDDTDILITEGRGIEGLQISGNTLVWQMLDTSAPSINDWDLEIFTYDILHRTLRQITDNNVDDSAPQVGGDLIAWTTTYGNGQTEIYYETLEWSFSGGGVIGFDPVVVLDPPFIPFNTRQTAESAAVVAAAVPEPASAMLLSIVGIAAINRRRPRSSVS
jgi:hypothetical protein